MKLTTIPAGYRVTINSWENDGDHKRALVFAGLSEETARFYVDFAKKLYSENNRKTSGFGNMYAPSEDELEKVHNVLKSVILKHWDAFIAFGYTMTQDELDEALYDVCSEIHYTLFGASDYHFRVLDSFKVEFIPVEIKIEDVSKRF